MRPVFIVILEMLIAFSLIVAIVKGVTVNRLHFEVRLSDEHGLVFTMEDIDAPSR